VSGGICGNKCDEVLRHFIYFSIGGDDFLVAWGRIQLRLALPIHRIFIHPITLETFDEELKL
jgi:hypothetical protein